MRNFIYDRLKKEGIRIMSNEGIVAFRLCQLDSLYHHMDTREKTNMHEQVMQRSFAEATESGMFSWMVSGLPSGLGHQNDGQILAQASLRVHEEAERGSWTRITS